MPGRCLYVGTRPHEMELWGTEERHSAEHCQQCIGQPITYCMQLIVDVVSQSKSADQMLDVEPYA